MRARIPRLRLPWLPLLLPLLLELPRRARGGGSAYEEVMAQLRGVDAGPILKTEAGSPSRLYTWEDFLTAVESSKARLYFGEEGQKRYGLANLAAFLAQSMKESIRADACDENNWSPGAPATSACGQLGESYQDYTCDLACEQDPQMTQRAETNAAYWGAPPPLFCAPKSLVPTAPKWNAAVGSCASDAGAVPHASVEEYARYVDQGGECRDYHGQQGGRWESCPAGDTGCANAAGRTDLENCCWWGRGVIQTTGRCNFGKLNHHLGAKAKREGRAAPYPDVDFCADPGAVCSTTANTELKWVAGLFYWSTDVEPFDSGGWRYQAKLKAFVDAGFPSPGKDQGFIHGVSGIVNRGCPNPPCGGGGALDGGADRAKYFETVLGAFGLLEAGAGGGAGGGGGGAAGNSTGPPAPLPSGDCKTCEVCRYVPGHAQAATDGDCAPCASGNQSWWPCDVEGLCGCAAPAAGPTPAPGGAPAPPGGSSGGSSGCKECAACKYAQGHEQAATDKDCGACACGKQTWWPCDVPGLCVCEEEGGDAAALASSCSSGGIDVDVSSAEEGGRFGRRAAAGAWLLLLLLAARTAAAR